MDMHQAFLADIAAHPEDDAPRLIYADWLEEHGDPALPYVPLDDETAVLLARSRCLKGLRELMIFEQPGLTDSGRHALEARFGDGLRIC
jgi:uncharacterized protein (TIGR02996 family)